MLRILLAGLLIRIIIGTFTINWDFLKVTQITAKMATSSLAVIYSDPLSLYPALTYYTRYFFIILGKPFLTDGFFQWAGKSELTLMSDPFIFRYLFLLKLPFILLELATAYVFSLLLPLKKRGVFLYSWMISPIAIYTIAAFTNVDVFPLFFIALSLLFFVKRRDYFSSFFLGVASAYKFFPGLILPFLIFSTDSMKKRVQIAFFFLLPFIGSQIPALAIPQYWQNSLLAEANRVIFTATLDIGHNKLVIFFVLFFALLFFKFITEKNKREMLPKYFFLPIMPVFIVSAFNVQWVYWILPAILFHLLYFKNQKIINIIFHLSILGIILLSQTALHIGMLSPIEPSLWTLDRPLNKYLGDNVFFLTNIFYSVISACLIYLSYRIYKAVDFFNSYEKA